MKRLFFYLSAVMLLVASPAIAVPYSDSVKVDANGATLPLGSTGNANKAITFTHGVTVNKTNLGITKEVYLSIRTDSPPCVGNLCGSGTPGDRYDCSGSTPAIKAAKLDAIIAAFPSNTNFYLAEGAGYYTTGWKFGARKTANNGCKWFGAGMGKTIIKLIGTETGSGVGIIFGADQTVRSPGFELHDMTLDCNPDGNAKWTSGSDRTLAAISVRPDNVWIDHVEVIRPGTQSAGAENFPIYVVAYQQSGTFENAIVSNCYVHDPAGNLEGISSIVVAVIEGGTGINLVARNNKVDMSGPGSGYTHGLGTSGTSESNTFINCDSGIYSEPNGVHTGLISRNDTFINCDLSVYSSARVDSVTDGMYVEGATIRDDGSTLHAGAISIGSDDNNVERYGEIVVNGCKWMQSSNLSMIAVTSAGKATVTNNRTNSSHASAVNVLAVTTPVVRGNLNNAGKPASCSVNTSSYRQPDELMMMFTPPIDGWYRIIDATGDVGGTIQLSDDYDGRKGDIEFKFNIAQAGNQGSIQQVRYSSYNGSSIDKARVSSSGASAVYLDIHVTAVTTPGPITVRAIGQRIPSLVAAPVVGATSGGVDENTIAFGHGFVTTRNMVAGGNIVASGNISGTNLTMSGDVAAGQVTASGYSGDGSAVSNVSVNAGDVRTTRRTVNDANYTVLTGNGDYLVAIVKLTAGRTVTLPAANLCDGCVRIIKDETNVALYGGGDANTYDITIAPDIENETKAITTASGAIKVYSNGVEWRTLP